MDRVPDGRARDGAPSRRDPPDGVRNHDGRRVGRHGVGGRVGAEPPAEPRDPSRRGRARRRVRSHVGEVPSLGTRGARLERERLVVQGLGAEQVDAGKRLGQLPRQLHADPVPHAEIDRIGLECPELPELLAIVRLDPVDLSPLEDRQPERPRLRANTSGRRTAKSSPSSMRMTPAHPQRRVREARHRGALRQVGAHGPEVRRPATGPEAGRERGIRDVERRGARRHRREIGPIDQGGNCAPLEARLGTDHRHHGRIGHELSVLPRHRVLPTDRVEPGRRAVSHDQLQRVSAGAATAVHVLDRQLHSLQHRLAPPCARARHGQRHAHSEGAATADRLGPPSRRRGSLGTAQRTALSRGRRSGHRMRRAWPGARGSGAPSTAGPTPESLPGLPRNGGLPQRGRPHPRPVEIGAAGRDQAVLAAEARGARRLGRRVLGVVALEPQEPGPDESRIIWSGPS